MVNLRVCGDCYVDDDQPEERGEDQHVVPRYDLRHHVLTENCWCKPELMQGDFEGRIYVHNSLDGCEDYQTGKRKVH